MSEDNLKTKMKFMDFTADNPCPICGHTRWCSIRSDHVIFCKHSPLRRRGWFSYLGTTKDGCTAMYRSWGPVTGGSARHDKSPPREASATSKAKALAIHLAAVDSIAAGQLEALAVDLQLPAAAMAALEIGWAADAQHHGNRGTLGAWTFPERDAAGELIGVTYRFPLASISGKADCQGRPLGNKSAPFGLRRGLSIPRGFLQMPDPVFVVEGASDVLAGVAAGITVVGRPSNVGGVDYLVQLCRDRRVIVLGENDRKADGRWPGKEGAESVARRLGEAWRRPVQIMLPPDGYKDLRVHVIALLRSAL